MKADGIENQTYHGFKRAVGTFGISILFFVLGIASLKAPLFFFEFMIDIAVAYLFFYSVYRILSFIFDRHKKEHIDQLVKALLSLGFGGVLVFYSFMPEWLMRVFFGLYMLAIGLVLLIQQMIFAADKVKVNGWYLVLGFGYLLVSFLVLFTPSIPTEMLVYFFGAYFMLLSLRFFIDTLETMSMRYTWKRQFHISPPAFIAVLLPDWTLRKINRHFNSENSRYLDDIHKRPDDRVKLKAMVHTGPSGLQKVGHFSFSYNDMVFSYGNYDASSGKLNGLMGDGVFFTVNRKLYLDMITNMENNTIFEFGIYLTKEQEEAVEKRLKDLLDNANRWYCPQENAVLEGLSEKRKELYANRLQYYTGAKFYKPKDGRFKTYWVLGDNCVMFADDILGIAGADALDIRGIITPGTYFDYLRHECAKENSPVLYCKVHRAKSDTTTPVSSTESKSSIVPSQTSANAAV